MSKVIRRTTCRLCGRPVDWKIRYHYHCAMQAEREAEYWRGVSEDWPEKEFADFAGLGRDPQEGEPQ